MGNGSPMSRDFLTRLKERLPKCPGIHGKEEYFNSAVLVLLCLIAGEYHLLFEKRASDIRQGGEICFPGGEHDPFKDADFQTTAVRETTEEIGIPAAQIDIIGVLDTLLTPMGVSVDVFVAVARIAGLEELRINPLEVDYCFTVPLAFFVEAGPLRYQVDVQIHPTYTDEKTGDEVILLPAVELGLPDKYNKPWMARRQNILAYRTEHGVIWGMTARLIWDLARRLSDR